MKKETLAKLLQMKSIQDIPVIFIIRIALAIMGIEDDNE